MCVEAVYFISNFFYRFPLAEPARNNLWIAMVGQEGFVPSENHKICSQHFESKDFVPQPDESKQLLLQPDAVPSIPSNTILTIDFDSLLTISDSKNTSSQPLSEESSSSSFCPSEEFDATFEAYFQINNNVSLEPSGPFLNTIKPKRRSRLSKEETLSTQEKLQKIRMLKEKYISRSKRITELRRHKKNQGGEYLWKMLHDLTRETIIEDQTAN